jgi:NADP-dependent 3-hydroxy acid dehydrogenase YdfG
MDVRDDASVQYCIQSIIDRAKRIDVLVNNAETSLIGAAEESTAAETKHACGAGRCQPEEDLRAVLN